MYAIPPGRFIQAYLGCGMSAPTKSAHFQFGVFFLDRFEIKKKLKTAKKKEKEEKKKKQEEEQEKRKLSQVQDTQVVRQLSSSF